MMDYTLKFPDEATAATALEPFAATHSIDIIGIIHKPTGEVIDTPEGPSPVMSALPGWHVNVRGPESEAIALHTVEVLTPIRSWA